jgi:peptidyl-prolyl cis-trans isomerase D
MFNLFRSREKSVRIILGGVLLLVALSMLTYLVPSYQTGLDSSDTVVAEIGKDTITVADLKKLIQNTLKGRELPPEVLPNYIPRLVDQMVHERALEYEALRLGFQVTDQDLATSIRQALPAELFPNGKFAGKEAYAMVLAQHELTMDEFESDMRRQILIHRLLDVAVEGTVVSDMEIEQTFKTRNEKIKLQYVKLTSDQFKKEVEPSAEAMKAYFVANANRYMDPATQNLAILYLDQAKLEQSLNPTDAELQAMYKQGGDQFRIPERVKVRHILLKTQGKPPADEPKIKAQADDILKQVKAGVDFASLVAKFSEDTGSKADAPPSPERAGLGPGEYWVERNGQMVKEFETAAFAQKPGESEVIKTSYGYHVIQVEEHQPGRVKPFDEVKADLINQYRTARSNAILQDASDKAETALKADPTHPEKVAAALNMQLLRVDNFSSDTPIPELGSSPEFNRSVDNLKPGEVSQAVSLAGNKLALAVVTGVNPARQKTFEQVQSDVRDKLTAGRLATALQKHAQELYDKAKEMNGDLEKAAKSMGFEVKTTEEFNRAGNIKEFDPKEPVQAARFKDGFTLPDGSVFGPVPLPSGTIIPKVIAHIAADMSLLPSQRDLIRDDIKKQKANDRDSLFEAGVVTELMRQGKLKIHKDVIDRVIQAYKG